MGNMGVHNRTTTDAVDRDTVDQVSCGLPGADITRKETQRLSVNSGESKPANFATDRQSDVSWEHWYRDIWKFKLRLEKQNNR